MASSRKVYVVGVGMTKFEKPGVKAGDYPDWAKEAATKALNDAGISFGEVQHGVVSYVYGDTTCGQRCLYELGMTGIPIYNVNNACSSGSTALNMAFQLIRGGIADCVLTLGFEKMERGSLTTKYTDRTNPMEKHLEVMNNTFGVEASPMTAQMFGNAGREHMEKYGTTAEHFAKIAWKNHKHSINNPYAQFQVEYSLDDIKKSPTIHNPLTKLQCSPTSDGAAACVLVSEEFVRRHHLESQAVEIVSQRLVTDLPSTFKENSCMKMVGYDMTRKAAEDVFKEAGLRPQEVDVIELHDCFSTNELITYEALGLCAPGKGGELVDKGNNTYGGQFVVNPSGGLISKGHPLGATGLAQCSELCWQLRGLAGKRQVRGAKLALQHNIGLGGAAVVTLYRLGFPQAQNRGRQLVAVSTSSSNSPGEGFKSAPIFKHIEEGFKKDGAAHVKKVNGTFLFRVQGPSTECCWFVDAKNGQGAVEVVSSDKKADCTIIMADEDLYALMTGQLNPQKAFMGGKLKIVGNMGLAMKLKEFQSAAATVKSKL